MNLILFTVEEANALLADLKPKLEELIKAKHEFDRLQAQVDVLSLAAAGAAPGNPDARDLRGVQERRKVVAEQISHGVGAIHRRGCLVKDLDRGLVDFYALAGDRLIFLCWQLGETEVTHWHTLEGGFAGRQPLHRSELE